MKFKILCASLLCLIALPISFSTAAVVGEGGNISTTIQSGETDIEVEGDAIWTQQIEINQARSGLNIVGNGGTVLLNQTISLFSNFSYSGNNISLTDLVFKPQSSTQNNRWLFAMESGNVNSYINLEGSIIDGFRTTPDKGGNFMYAYGSSDITVNGGTAGLIIRNNRAEWDSAGGLAIMDGRVTMLGNFTFENNWTGNYGGAVTLYDRNNSLTFNDGHVAFNNNHAVVFGGAMDVWGNQNTVIFNSTAEFNGNYVYYTGTAFTENSPRHVNDQHARGGAINIGYIASSGSGASVTFNDTVTFTGNYAISTGTTSNTRNALGGAISVYGNGNSYLYTLNFNAAAIFEGNYVYALDNAGTGNGGAIFYDSGAAVLNLTSGSRFSNNYAKTYGGAIYLQAGTINLTADNGDIIFQGNRHGASFDGDYKPIDGTGTPNAIYLGSGGNLNIAASQGNSVWFYDPIGSIQGSNVVITKTGEGDVVFSGDGSDSDLYWSNIQVTTNVNEGRFLLNNGGRYGNQTTGNFNVAQNAALLGGGGGILYTPQLSVAAGGLLGVSDGIFTLNATSITLGDGATLFGDGQLNASTVLNMAGSVDANIDDGDELVLNQALSGAGGLNKIGNGTLTLAVASLYTGTTAVNAGNIAAAAENVLINSSSLTLAEGSVFELRDFDQTVNNLTGAGDVELGSADLRVVTNENGIYSGTISGSGALTKAGDATWTLSGNNSYSGGTTIESGRIVATNGSALGSGTVTWDNNGSLELGFATDGTLANLLEGTGALVKSGAGRATLTAAGSSSGVLTVQEGILDFEQQGAFNSSQFTVNAGAGAAFGAAATLNTGGYIQNDGTTLEIAYRDSDNAVITTGSALIGGDLLVTGFEPTAGNKASTLNDDRFLVISSNSMIMGSFFSVDFQDFTLPYDFIVIAPGFNNTRTEYYVGLGLAWFADAARSSGTFTLDSDESFEVDVVLSSQNTGDNWDGLSLTKAGEGELILSEVNTYSGATNINAGILTAGTANVIAESGNVTVADGATLDMGGFDQSVRNLRGEGDITMGAGNLTVTSTDSTIFSGNITGSGGLNKDGDASLTLSGENAYSGGTVISRGRLIATVAAALGSGDIAIADNGSLELNFDDDETLGQQIQGSGGLIKSGDGQTTLTATGSAGSVQVSSGILAFSQNGAFNGGQFTTAGGAGVIIGAASTLNATSFNQADGSSLEIAYRDSDSAVINTGSAYLGGSLTVTGFTPEAGASASSLTQNRFLVVSSTSAIQNEFSSVAFGNAASPYDFLVLAPGFNSDRTEFYVGLGLAWFADAAQSSGTFTLGAGESFDVDVILSNQSVGNNWNGNNLIKEGDGVLTLSAVNTYSGATSINAGTLTTGVENAFAQSGSVSVGEGATLNMNGYSQTARNLTGEGAIELGSGTLSVISDADGIFSGGISGSGGLVKQGDASLTLSGQNDFSGGTYIDDGRIIATNGQALGSGDITSDIDGTLELQFESNETFANLIDGIATLVKSGEGRAALTANGSSATAVNVIEGTLALEQNGAFRAGGLSTASGAGLYISSLSTLNTGSLVQADSSRLEIGYRNSDSAVITTDTATIGGSLLVTGFAPAAGATASSLSESRFLLISSGSAIQGEFLSVNIGSYDSPYDFIVLAPGFNSDRTQYFVGLSLAWFVAGDAASGTFTLNEGETFDVDVALSNQTGNGGWGGTSLIKAGDGELVLSAVNTYTGATNINGGTLTTGEENVFEQSSGVTVADGATLNLNGYNQSARNLDGAGSIALGAGDLTVVSDASSRFSGNIDGSGALIKNGGQTLTLSGQNGYTGGTSINAGRLIATRGEALGSGVVITADNATLELAFTGESTFSNTLRGGSLVNSGAGKASLTGQNSTVGAVTNTGNLSFETGDAFTAESYASQGGTTSIVGMTYLDAGSKFSQDQNSVLNVEVKADQAAIVADEAEIDGILNIAGFTSTNVTKASDLEGQRFNVIETTGGITGEFDQVNFGSVENPADYLQVTGRVNDDSTVYSVGFDLTWLSGAATGNGIFTLGGASDRFEVDFALGDQDLDFTSGWDGQSLTKRGAGTLVLSAENTYTGATNIEGGTLEAGVQDAISYSEEVNISDGATFDTGGFDQHLNNLTGDGSVLLSDGSQLNLYNTSESAFSGIITGDGRLFKNGDGTLVLSGDSDYTGGSSVQLGRLVAESGGALGSGDVLVYDGATLELRSAGDMTFSNLISGGGNLEKTGSGTARLDSAGSSIRNVNLTGGSLAFEQAGVFNAENYTAASGTETQLASGSSLAVENAFVQQAGSDLTVGLSESLTTGESAITADTADITGSNLSIAGFTADAPMKASELAGTRFTIIDTVNGITGDFAEVSFGGTRDDRSDYLQVSGMLSSDNLQYSVGLALSWLTGSSAHGNFTLDDADEFFEVDIALENQIATGGWDGQSLTKRGIGTLLLSAANTYSGTTNVEEGLLLVGDADSTGASISGGGVTVAEAAVLSGTGSISGSVTNEGTLASLNAISGYSTAGPGTFTVGGLVNSGTVLLAGAEVGNRLVVNGDWTSQDGSLILNTVLGGDDSATDRLVLDGGTTSGTTSLVIRNRGGAGGATNVGILLVEATNGATTGADAFSLSSDSAGFRANMGTIVAGAYDYSLLRGGNGGNAESWYLSSAFRGGEGPGPARPEASVYIAQREAAESMFAIRMHDRQAGYELFREPDSGTKGPGAAWGMVYGGERRSRADNENSSSKIVHGGMMAGVDLFRMAKPESGSFQAGIMAGMGMADIRTHLRENRDYKAKGDVTGYTAGLYGSWFQDTQRLRGLWADAWVQHGWFENELHGGGLPTESYDTRQWSASIEVGYLIPIYANDPTAFGIEPVAQVIWSSYHGGNHTEDNGTRVEHGKEDNLSTRLGARFRAGVSTQRKVWLQPYAEAYWWHNTARHKVNLDDDRVRSSVPRNSAEVRAGVEVQPTRNVGVNLEAIGRFSGHGYRDLGGQVGLRYEF